MQYNYHSNRKEQVNTDDSQPRANGRNIVGCYMLRPFAHPVAYCYMLLGVVMQRLKPVKLLSQQLPTILLFHDRRSVAQQCWIHLHSSSGIVGATQTHYMYTWSPWSICPNNVGSCCIHSHTTANTDATIPNIVNPTKMGVEASICTQLQ